MGYWINGIHCDTYAYIDQKRTGDTVRISAANAASHTLVAFLYCDKKAFPVSANAGLTASCCIRYSGGKTTLTCQIGAKGEIIVPLTNEICTEGQRLMCEIIISGTADGESFRYRAFEFCAAVVA